MTVLVPALPTPAPQSSDPLNFDARADAFHAAFPGVLEGMNAQNVENNALNAVINARRTEAEASAASALASAQAAANSAGATRWASGTTYAVGATAWSPLDARTYRRLVAGAGTTDPSLDPTNWRAVALDVDTGLPAIRPSLLLDFVNTRQVDPRGTFTRPTPAARMGPGGVLVQVAANVPRLGFDAVTRACRGLLVEKASTNLALQSEAFNLSPWLRVGSSVVPDSAAFLDGSMLMDKLVEDSSNGQHRVSQSVTLLAGNPYTYSVFLKAAERTSAQLALHMFDGTNLFVGGAPRCVVNLSTGQITSTTAGASSSIEHVGSGVYRVSITGTMGGVGGSQQPGVFLFNGTTNSYTGDGTSGIYLWGAQLDPGSFPTSYIPTTTAQATRAGDSLVFTGANFSSWARADEGTLVLEVERPATSDTMSLQLTDGTASNRIVLAAGGNGLGQALVTREGVEQVNLFTATAAAGSVLRVALAFRAGDFALATNGLAVATVASGQLPTVNRLSVGSGAESARIRRAAFYPARLSNPQLQALSAL